jgi:hypothetical protein
VLGLAGLLACGFLIAAGAAGAQSSFVPAGEQQFPGWLAGPFAVFNLTLSFDGFEWLLLAMCACYVLALIGSQALHVRTVLSVIVLLHVIFVLAPPLFSADIFGYVAFARLGALHHIDPYAHGAVAAPLDPVLPFVRWGHLTSPYGPVFTLLTYPFVPLGVSGAFWTLKVAAGAASLGVLALVARLAERLDRPVIPALAFVGLNPLLLVYGVGGGHNVATGARGPVAGVLGHARGVALLRRDRVLTSRRSRTKGVGFRPKTSNIAGATTIYLPWQGP